MNHSHFFRRLLFYLIVTSIGLVSCYHSESEKINNVFRYNESSGVVSLDPAFAKDLPHIWICNQLYNRLVSLDSNLKIVPSIAKQWEISNDGLQYTFFLRDDVYFNDNQCFKGKSKKVTDSDFVYSFSRILDPTLMSPGSWIFNSVSYHAGKPAFHALHDTIFQIVLSQANPSFLGILSMVYASVVPNEAIEYYGSDFRFHPVGSGPFKMLVWKDGVKLVLTRNDTYFEQVNGVKLPYLQGISISFLADRQTAFLQFIKGEFEFMSGIDARYKDELLNRNGQLNRKYSDKLRLKRGPFLNTEYLGFFIDTLPGKVNPVRNLAMRQAINYAINREKMLKFLRNGIGKPGNSGMIPFGMPGHDLSRSIGYAYHPAKALQLIKENSLDQIPVTLTTTAEYVDLAKFVQSQCTSLGLQISIEISQPATLRQARAMGKLSFFRSSWVADYPDAENYLFLFTTQNFAPAGPNYTHFSDSRFDQWYVQSMRQNDPTLREKLYLQMDSLMMTQAPVVVLFYDESLWFLQDYVKDLTANAINNLDLRKVKLAGH